MSSHPSSSSSAAFHKLAEPVRRWIWSKGWPSLRDIQEQAINILLDGERDLIISAPTAGGKTEAAFLPLISSVLSNPGQTGFDLVYVSPLRALINDQFERLEDLCVKAELPVHPWHGDISQSVKARARRNPSGVLLITPESLEALFVLRGLEVPTLFSGTRAIIIDELHALLDNERGVHLRSLITRLELATGHRIRRVGLSATLSETSLVKEYLRPEDPESVDLLESSESKGLLVQLRGYCNRSDENGREENSVQRSVAAHLFSNLRGRPNLIFAESRQNVELYADTLREISERERAPLEFFPHHASLSREHRMDLEKRLKTHAATTAICTSTLELGIDIGNIECVAQIGAPFSVASLRQRLGRSGRRQGQPAVLRMYAIERDTNTDSHPLDRLHLRLIRSIAMMELLIDKWCEPPAPDAMHLSTLTHQILSVIAEHGGARADRIYESLCVQGPFRRVGPQTFTRLLRQIGNPEVALIEQGPDGDLLLGTKGERLVEHYSFYAVFQTYQEYRVTAGGKLIGTVSTQNVFTLGMTIILSGRRWRITGVYDQDKVIEVTAYSAGRPPAFDGDGNPLIHDRVIEKMKEVLSDTDVPTYLDTEAASILERARSEFKRMGLQHRSICNTGERNAIIATWAGTVKTSSLALQLQAMGHTVTTFDGFLDIHENNRQSAESALEEIAKSKTKLGSDLLFGMKNMMTEKYHCFLSDDLLIEDAISSRVDLSALPELAGRIIGK